jgi:hypothetical protein
MHFHWDKIQKFENPKKVQNFETRYSAVNGKLVNNRQPRIIKLLIKYF